MKIDIITIRDLNNYGNRLQNYAVQCIFENLGFEVSTIDLCYEAEGFDRDEKKKEKFRQSGNILQAERMSSFEEFTHKFIKEKKYTAENIFNETFEYVALGGDQVWGQYMFTYKLYGYQFGSIVAPEYRIPISPSFGGTSVPENKKSDDYAKHISEFKHICVREESGKDLIYKLTGRKATVLMDPVMVLELSEWKKIFDVNKYSDENYILTCFLGGTDEDDEDSLSKISNGVPLKRLCDKSSGLYSASPSDFLSYIYNAKLVCTNSFHCVAFAILFKKPFVVFDRKSLEKSQMTRLFNLLDKFSLRNRHIDDIDLNEIYNIDYSNSDDILNVEQKKLYDFIRQWDGVKNKWNT